MCGGNNMKTTALKHIQASKYLIFEKYIVLLEMEPFLSPDRATMNYRFL